MEPLTKLILNNKIVDMRHSVKQSRIQSINKLVKEIKRLRNSKGTEEKKTKCKNKADRFVECIQIMKKVKEDDVSKFALMNEKSLAEITNNVKESPEIKAIARIADHRPVHDKVKAFREKYPDWKETLPLLFDSLGDRYQEKKKYKNNSKKKTKPTENKTKSTSGYQKNNSNVTYIHNKLGTWRVEEIVPSKEDDVSDTKSAQNISNNENNDVTDTRSAQKIDNNENRKEIVKKSSSDEIDRPLNEEVEKDGFFEKSRNNLANKMKKMEHKKEISREKNVKKLTKENETPIIEEKITKTVDPFFVTKDNKEYLSINAVNNAPSQEEEKPEFVPKKFKKNFSEPKSYEKNWKQPKINNVSKKYPKIEAKEETLHPSWEAKRKQSSISITQFQGKKVKFDD